MQPELAVFVIPGLFFVMILGLVMQFLRSRDMREAGVSKYTSIINMMFFIVLFILLLVVAMVIVSRSFA